MRAIGFEDDGGDNYVLKDEQFKHLSRCLSTIDENHFDIAKIFMTDEERKKEEVLREERKIQQDKLRKEKAEKD